MSFQWTLQSSLPHILTVFMVWPQKASWPPFLSLQPPFCIPDQVLKGKGMKGTMEPCGIWSLCLLSEVLFFMPGTYRGGMEIDSQYTLPCPTTYYINVSYKEKFAQFYHWHFNQLLHSDSDSHKNSRLLELESHYLFQIDVSPPPSSESTAHYLLHPSRFVHFLFLCNQKGAN